MASTGTNVNHLYENLDIGVANVKHIKERMASFMAEIEVPEEIKTATADFVNIMDDLQRDFVTCIERRKVMEKEYEQSKQFFHLSQYRWNGLNEGYIEETGSHYQESNNKLIGNKFCLIVSQIRLDTATRELRLSKEKLCLQSKKAEHIFCSTLDRHANHFKFDSYKSMVPSHRKKLKYTGSPVFSDKGSHNTNAGSGTGFLIDLDEPTDENTMNAEEKYANNQIVHFEHEVNDYCTENSSSYEPLKEISVKKVGPEVNTYEPADEIKVERLDGNDYENLFNTATKFKRQGSTHVYEDLNRYTRNKQKDEKKNVKKKTFAFLKNHIHGPWEGWDEL